MILLFDTSTPTGYLALGDNTQLRASAMWQAEQSHSRQLPPQILTALQSAGLATADLTHIAVGIGPGSFTGLRVALATAKGLGISLGVPIIAIASLKLFAAACRATTAQIVSTTDAFRGELYVGIYEQIVDNGTVRSFKQKQDILSMTPTDAIEAMRHIKDPFTITGTGFVRYEAELTKQLGPVPFVPLTDPDFAGMLGVAAEYCREARFADPAAILPYYVRHAEAVEKHRK
jgi:tRNA threonylcarbamoyladenosine biosynthesis protein TsaB